MVPAGTSEDSEAMIDWRLAGIDFGNCNCDYGCPCQFESRPTQGNCRGFGAARVERGHFGDVRLDGLSFAVTYAWPGAVNEGNGEMQAIIDERADDRQRQALKTILHGGETAEAMTHWWVFHAMSSKVHGTLYKPIVFEADIDRRIARVSIPGVLEATGRPIMSPVNGKPHRIRIDLPDGIEFEIAEIGSASTTGTGAIALDLKDSYGQFNRMDVTGKGLVRSR
jgi:hypothetical protein